jgi:hypothetical protein
MDNETLTLGPWSVQADGPDSDRPGLMILGERDTGTFALAGSLGEDRFRLALFADEQAALTAGGIIEALASAPEGTRIGGRSVSDGLGTSHPGVEWVTAAAGPGGDFAARLRDSGTVRLWAVGSVDGGQFALLNPGAAGDERVLAHFDSRERAGTMIQIMDALAWRGHPAPRP